MTVSIQSNARLEVRPLGSVATVLVSNVDKLSHEHEVPVRLCNYTDVYKNAEVHPDLDLMEATATRAEIIRFRLQVDDTVFTKDSETADDIGVPAFVTATAEDFICGYHLAIARPDTSKIHPKYLYWWLTSREAAEQWAVRASGVTRVGLRQSDIRSFPLTAHTNLEDQRAIAEFLDREIAQIDATIEAQHDLAAKLEERRVSVLTQAATPYLWSGDRLKAHLAESDARVGAAADTHILLSVSIDWGVRPRDESVQQAASEDLSNYKLVREGDIVVNRMRAFQGALGRAPQPGMVSPDYSVFRPRDTIDSNWLAGIMRSAPFVGEMTSRIRGIGSVDAGQVRTPRINAADLLSIRVTVPSLVEQRESFDTWSAQSQRMDAMIEGANDTIVLMQERRAALISAAVTGRIDPYTGQERLSTEEAS